MQRLVAYIAAYLFCILCNRALSQTYTNIPVHDPVLIKQDSVYYVFCTGMGISKWSSLNLKDWKKEPPVFATAPAWAVKEVPGYKGHTWAPDISYHNGLYYLFYSASAFGKNTSCIGVATSKTLHTGDTAYHWTDHGKIIQSVPGRDMWNAIDPNLAFDDNGTPWLVFGSFWNGIKLVELQNNLLAVAQPEQWYSLAARGRNKNLPDTVAGDAAIEAPFIFKKNGWYYLFVSFDYCCRGEKSNYKIMVGRSKNIFGPYTGKDGTPMTAGGGSLLKEGDHNWYGVGHCAVTDINGIAFLVYHGYDAADKGRSKLLISALEWKDDWPAIVPGQ